MTARLYPQEPVFAAASEQLFVESLQESLPDDAVLVCGRRFSDRGQDREADVILAWTGVGVGVAVIEVKGGSVYLAGGEWRQSGGGIDKVIHPVEQARACKYLLRGYLDRHPGWTAGNPRLAHLVALPDDDAARRLSRAGPAAVDGAGQDRPAVRRLQDRNDAAQGREPARPAAAG